MSDPQKISVDQQIQQARTIKRLTANNSQLRAALRLCLGVLGGLELNKNGLIRALEAGKAALEKKKPGDPDV